MKKINLILLLLCLTTVSCKNFLQEEPLDELSADQDFQVPNHAYSAVNSLYRNGAPQLFDGGVYSGSRAMIGQYMSGFFDNEYKGQEIHVQNAQQLTLNGTNLSTYLEGIWYDLYVGISRANNAIKRIPTTPDLTEKEVRTLTAEARFFRAFAYYYLIRMFGEVPLITEPYQSLDNLYISRSSVKEVYTLIEADLKYAVEEGELPETSMVTNGKRITKGTAATVLAEVYLTMSGFPLQENRYADAAAMAKSVINSGTYSLEQHSLVNNQVDLLNSAYNKLRRSDASPTESVFLHEYTVAISESPYPQYSYPNNKPDNVKYSLTNGAYQPVPEFLAGYDATNDLRRQEKQYFHTSITLPSGSVQTFQPTPYFWHDDAALFETAGSGKDFVIYSYADVLLIAAEAIAQSEGVTAEAVNYLSQVRSRAYWNTPEALITAQLTALPAPSFVEEVWKERYRELVFEFKLWFDIVRTRKFPQTNPNNPGQITFVNVVGQSNSWGKVFEEKHLLLPISDAERQRNPSLGNQNPGY